MDRDERLQGGEGVARGGGTAKAVNHTVADMRWPIHIINKVPTPQLKIGLQGPAHGRPPAQERTVSKRDGVFLGGLSGFIARQRYFNAH